MPDTTPTPAPAPAPTKPKRTRADMNQADAAELTLAGELASTAEKSAYAAPLAGEGIDAPFILNLRTKIEQAGGSTASAVGKKAAKKSDTKREEDLKNDLLEKIGVIQARAKRKFKLGNPQRAKYFIGKTIEASRVMLESSTETILVNLGGDALPGMKAGDPLALKNALKAYRDVQTDQSGNQSGAAGARGDFEAKVKEVADLRREIQYAVDAVWPSSKKANAAIRIEFQIPADRAMK